MHEEDDDILEDMLEDETVIPPASENMGEQTNKDNPDIKEELGHKISKLSGGSADLGEIFSAFNDLKDNIEDNFRDDRLKIQDYLNLISNDGSAHGYKNAHFEAIASLMSTKASTTSNRVKLLDSLSKIISATKNYGNNNDSSDDEEDLRSLINESSDEP